MGSPPLLLLLGVVGVVMAEQVLLHERKSIPLPYYEVEKPLPSEEMTITIVTKQKNVDLLYERLRVVTDPRNAEYSQWMTREEMLKLNQDKDSQAVILSYLSQMREQHRAEQGEFKFEQKVMMSSIQLHTTVGFLEKIFDTQMGTFRTDYTDSQKRSDPFSVEENFERKTVYVFPKMDVVRSLKSLHLPSHVRKEVVMVLGVMEFPVPKKLTQAQIDKRNAQGGSHDPTNVPYTIRQLYSIPNFLLVENEEATQAPYAQALTSKDGYGESDLVTYEKANALDSNSVYKNFGNGLASYTAKPDDGEATLDVQLLVGLGQKAKTGFYLMAAKNGWMYEWASDAIATEDSPVVLSASYGWYENEQCNVGKETTNGNCQALGFANWEEYITQTDLQFMKLGLMGHTITVASGDSGSEGNYACTKMDPEYPASSAYVTSVGASSCEKGPRPSLVIGSDAPPICQQPDLYDVKCNTRAYEVAAMDDNDAEFDTGGGFSSYVETPWYQEQALSDYFKSGVNFPPFNTFNSSKRGYPDVAAAGDSIGCIERSKFVEYIGTSASCPIVAGIVTLLNDARISAGKNTLGFINPLLYSLYNSTSYNNYYQDITLGENGDGCDNLAFHAAQGWDALTGLGTLNFTAIKDYVITLP